MPKTTKGGAALNAQVTAPDLSGGVDLRRSPTLVAANRSRVCRNWTLDEPGALKVYPGWASWLTSSFGATRNQGGRRIYLTGVSPFTLFANGGDVYSPSDAGVPGSADLTGLDSSNEVDFPYDADLVAVMDGASVPKKSTNGTTWTGMGIAAPAAAATAADLAGGSLTSGDAIEMSYSYQDDELGHEGNESDTVSHTPSGGNLSIRYTIPRSSDPQVDTINVYVRDSTAGEEVRRFAGSVANPGVGSATFDLTSIAWEDGDEAPTDHDVPLALQFAVPWKSRWWGVRGRTLYFTQIFEPQSWPALFFIDIPFEKGDVITAIIPQGDTLVVFGSASKPYLIIGQTSLDFEVRPAFGAQAGALGFRAVTAIENGILHAANEGVYLFDGATDRLLSDDIDPGWQDAMQRADVEDLARVALLYDTPRKFVHVAIPRLYPFGEPGEWVLDLHRTRTTGVPAWTSTDRPVAFYVPWDGPESDVGSRGRLFAAALDDGDVTEECSGTSADGHDLVCDYAGPTFATGGRQGRFINLHGEYRPAAGVLAVEVLVDGQTVVSDTPSIDDGLSFYGVAEYGVDSYGGPERRAFPIDLPIEAEGLTAQVKYRYTGQDRYAAYGYLMDVVEEAQPRGMRA